MQLPKSFLFCIIFLLTLSFCRTYDTSSRSLSFSNCLQQGSDTKVDDQLSIDAEASIKDSLATITGLKKDVTLNIWLVGSKVEANILKDVSKEFTERTGINIECSPVPWSDAQTKYTTTISASPEKLPDIGAMGLTWANDFSRLKIQGEDPIIDINKEFPEFASQMHNDIFESLMACTESEGKRYAVPLDLNIQLLYYRSDIVRRPPESWDELECYLNEMWDQSGKLMMYGWGSVNWIGLFPFLYGNGGSFYNDTLSEPALNSPEAVEAIAYFTNLYKNHAVPVSPKFSNVVRGMKLGRYPLAIDGSWIINSMILMAPELKGKWSVALLPKGPKGKRTSFIGGRVMAVFKNSNYPKESVAFLKYLLSPKVQNMIFDEFLKYESMYFPVNRAAWSLIKFPEGAPLNIKHTMLSQIDDSLGPYSVPGWEASEQDIIEGLQQVIYNNMDIKKAFDKVVEGMKFKMEKYANQ